MFKSIVNWWKGQFGDGSVTYQEDKSVITQPKYTPFYGVFPDGSKVKLYKLDRCGVYVDTPCGTYGFPTFEEWEKPMIELFLLMVKDRKNWNKALEGESTIHYTHNILGIKLSGSVQNVWYEHHQARSIHWSLIGLTLTDPELKSVIYAVDLYQFTDKFKRLMNINLICKQRLDKLNRENDANRIREYLEGK